MKRKGFTLVEVILSIALIGLIAVVFVPAMSNGFRLLTESDKFVVDSYEKQKDVEKLLEEKRNQVATGAGTTQLTIFGKNISGHLISVDIEGHGVINAFQPERTVTYDVLEIVPRGHTGNPDVLLDVVSVSPRPSTIDMFQLDGSVNSNLELLVNENYFTVNEPTLHLLNVYRWFLSSEQPQTMSYLLDNFHVIKEWNPARGLVSYADSQTMSIIPNIQNSPDYNRFRLSEVINGYTLTNEQLINQYGNRYIYYSVTPYSISGRIGKEELSNPIYINAPKIQISRAYFGANSNEVEVLFDEPIGTSFDPNLMTLNPSLGTLNNISRSATNDKLMILSFAAPLDGTVALSGNTLKKGAVASNLYGKISIWKNGVISGDFTIDPAGTVYVTGVTLNQTNALLYIDDQITLVPTVLPATATQKNVTWESSDTNIAEVDASGVVTAKAKGTARITVTTVDGGYKAYFDLIVSDLKMILQLDANVGITQSGGSVSTWSDQSEFNNHFSQSTANKRPLFIATATGLGRPAIRFDGNNDALVSANALLSDVNFDTDSTSNKFTTFIVSKANSKNSNSAIFSKSGTWNNQSTYVFGRSSDGRFAHVLRGSSSYVGGNNFNNLHISQWNGSSFSYRINQRIQTAPSIGNKTVQSNLVTIGAANSGASDYLYGDISEIRIYKGDLTDPERDAIEFDLIEKWLTLKSWHFTSNTEGFGNPYRISSFSSTPQGTVSGTITNSGAYFESQADLKLNITNAKRLQIKMKNSTNQNSGRIEYKSSSTGAWSNSNFTINANSDFTIYEVDLSSASNWTGTLYQFRIYPSRSAGSGSFEIDYIRILE